MSCAVQPIHLKQFLLHNYKTAALLNWPKMSLVIRQSETYQSMLDDQYSRKLASSANLGIAEARKPAKRILSKSGAR